MSKVRLCRCGCKSEIPVGNTLRKWATVDCAFKLLAADRAKKERKALSESRKQTRADKARIKKRSEWAAETQTAFNAWIRERDRLDGCISCGTTRDVQYCAGHYRTIGACPELRYEPLNVHKQCNKNCNGSRSGNIVEYRINLLKKIGPEKLAWLEGPHEPKKYSIPDLQEIKTRFTKMRKALEMDRL